MYAAKHPRSPDARIFIARAPRSGRLSPLAPFRQPRVLESHRAHLSELDLRDGHATTALFDQTRPEIVIAAAARVGGIAANASRPAEFISDNLRIQVNVLDSAVATGVDRFLFLGSSCIYPKSAPQPIREDALFAGPLEETNQSYAAAKLADVAQLVAIRPTAPTAVHIRYADEPLWAG